MGNKPVQRTPRFRYAGRAASTVAGVIAITLAVTQLPSAATAFGYAARLPAPAGSPRTAEVNVAAISCPTLGNCTAAGSYLPSKGSSVETPVVITKSGGKWTARKLSLPSNATVGAPTDPSYLDSVWCSSPSDCIALGSYVAGVTLEGFVATESSGTWSRGVELPTPSNEKAGSSSVVAALSCTLVTSCVVVGGYASTSSDSAVYVDTETGGAWTAQAIAEPSGAEGESLNAVNCTSPGNCEAVGGFQNAKGNWPIVLRETDGTWNRGARLGLPRNANVTDENPPLLDAVSCPTALTCIAGGEYGTPTGDEGFFDSESGGVWAPPTEAILPRNATSGDGPAGIQALACTGPGRCVAGGYYVASGPTFFGATLGATFRKVGGSWSRGVQQVGLPAGAATPGSQDSSVSGVACTRSNECVIVGLYSDAYSTGSFAATPARPPSEARITKITPLVNGFRIAVKAPASNGGLSISNYQYSLDGGAAWKNSASGSSTSILIPRLSAHRLYILCVRAVTEAGSGPRSQVVAATTK